MARVISSFVASYSALAFLALGITIAAQSNQAGATGPSVLFFVGWFVAGLALLGSSIAAMESRPRGNFAAFAGLLCLTALTAAVVTGHLTVGQAL